MKSADKVRNRVSSRRDRVSHGPSPDRVCRVIDPDEIGGDAWSALVRHARSCDPEAYANLYLLLGGFRRWFTSRVFADPESVYSEFVTEMVDRIRYGFLRDPESLLVQARARAVRRAADRIRSLTAAARVLSAIPERDRELWIRSQMALGPSAGSATLAGLQM